MCVMFDVCQNGSTKGGDGDQMAERYMSLNLTFDHEGFEAEYVFSTMTDDCLWGCSSKFFKECTKGKISFTAYDFSDIFDRGGVMNRCKVIGVAMGYRVVASNPGLDAHPFLRSWIAEQVLVVGNLQQCIGIAVLGSQTIQPLLAFGINFLELRVSCVVR